MSFNEIKEFNGQKYTGVSVGSGHAWQYPDGTWEETKVAPDKWSFRFSSIKRRREAAPEGSGVPLQTEYHWYILADQIVKKINANEYQTVMEGTKLKIGHKRPYWKGFSYTYNGQQSYKQKLLTALRETVQRLEMEGKDENMHGL
ncbi:MAG: hypothetical protein Q8P40_13775 [Nitrospirota bacterium]|nr:hypothetical protein [Nitrospirota bacterium]